MRDAFIDRKFQHLRIDHDEANIFCRALVEHRENHGVHRNRLTGTGRAGYQQVRHTL